MNVDIRDALFDTIYDLAAADKNIVFLTADADALSLRKFKRDFPDRFINVGVAEQNMATVATGLALTGKRVFMYSILSFVTLRCYEQIKFNICSMKLPVTMIGLGTGFSFDFDGPSHHGVVDVGVMRMLPEVAIFNPSNAMLAAQCVRAACALPGPSLIRLDKGIFPTHDVTEQARELGFSKVVNGARVCFMATGAMVYTALKVADNLRARGLQPAVIDMFRLKPVSTRELAEALAGFDAVVSLEEHVVQGGLGSILAELKADADLGFRLKRIGVPDEQTLIYGTRSWLLQHYKLDETSVTATIAAWLNIAEKEPR